MKIVIEIVLGILVFFAGQTFWQLRKREKFVRSAIQVPEFLQTIVSKERLSSPPPHMLAFVQGSEYALNIKCVIDADRASQRRVAISHGFVIAAIFVGSYFMGPVYLGINVIMFFATKSIPIASSVKGNAIDHILTLGLILHRWRLVNAKECDEFVEHAQTLRPLYNAVQKTQ